MSQGFEIKQVKHYTTPRYHSLYADNDTVQVKRPSVAMVLFSFAMMMVIGLSLSGCWGGLSDRFHDPFDVITSGSDGGPDGGPDPDASGEFDGGDITMGVMVECYPGDIVCDGDDNLMTCTDGYYYEQQSCDEICAASAPEGFGYSLGCDVNAEDPCQCDNDVIDGGMAYCEPDEIRCESETSLMVCDANSNPSWTDCEQECDQRFNDEAAYSLGCDAEAEDPCQCQYDIAIGDVAVCTPGDIRCLDEATVELCDDTAISTIHSCESYCQENFGEDYTSIGCTELDPDNFCGCKPDSQ